MTRVPDLIIYLGAAVGALATIFGAMAAAWRFALQPLLSAHLNAQKTQARVDAIWKELSPNGGASLWDSIHRIDSAVSFAERRSKVLLQDAPYGVVETDADGLVTWVNRTYLGWAGRTLEEMEGAGWINAIHPSDRDRVVAEWQSAVAARRDVSLDFCLTARDGSKRHVSAQTYVILGPRSPQGWVAVIHSQSRS